MMDTNGIPSVVGGLPVSGAFSTEAGKNELLQLSGPSQVGVSTLVATMLAMQEAEQVVAVNTAARKIVCGPVTAKADPINDIATMAGCKTLVLVPSTGQDGRSLEWEISGTPTTGFNATTKSAIDAILAPVIPTYTVGSLVQRIAQDLPDNADAHIVVDQEAGTVTVYQKGDGTIQADVMDPLPFQEAGGIVVALSEPSTSGVSALKFEGGQV